MSNHHHRDASSSSKRHIHLVVFIHGFEGTGNDFDNCERAFVASSSKFHETLHVFKPVSNSGFCGTYDGIENGAIRIWKEIRTVTLQLGMENIKAISLVGHSLGGLYARYVARLLDDCLFFEEVEPRFFITLASPHLSVRRPQTGPFNVAFQRVAQLICKTAKELCMEDDGVKPILYRMTEEMYVRALRKFAVRVLYSNVANDFQVHYSTSSISMFNPYTKRSGGNGHSVTTNRSLEYSDLTGWSLEQVSKRLRHDVSELDRFANRDSRGVLLRAMFHRLNQMEWERYDAVFPTVFAHEQIIHKRSMFAGREVVRHMLTEVFHRPPQITSVDRSPSLKVALNNVLDHDALEDGDDVYYSAPTLA